MHHEISMISKQKRNLLKVKSRNSEITVFVSCWVSLHQLEKFLLFSLYQFWLFPLAFL